MKGSMRNTVAAAVLAAGSLVVAGTIFATSAIAAPKTQASKLNDPTIVAIFDAANTWDMETGGLAAKRGKTHDVREFAEMLVRDHKAVRQQGRDLAKKLGVTPTPPKDFQMAKDHAAAMKKLRSLHGAAFDRAFLAHEVAYHKAVNGALETQLIPSASNAELKSLLQTGLKIFQGHQQHAEHVAAALK